MPPWFWPHCWLSGALTLLVMVLLPLPLNYANIIALPLLLGVGVSFNIYFVMNWRDGLREMLASATARAVAFSALTTGTAFGSLAISEHPGTASMGSLLLISLGCTLAASLIFIPALLAALGCARGDWPVWRPTHRDRWGTPADGMTIPARVAKCSVQPARHGTSFDQTTRSGQV